MIKILIMDVDGTLTDGKIYMGPCGEAMKAFSVKDGYGINNILRPNGIEPAIITGRKSSIVENRCTELGITLLRQGIADKKAELDRVLLERGLRLSEAAYIGDDENDMECIRAINEAGGITGCPADAMKTVRKEVTYLCEAKGGDGAVREFVEYLVYECE